MNPKVDLLHYERCVHCWHFVDENPSYFEGYSKDIATHLHLDDGEVEHDHDAEPGESNTLAWWKTFHPELFETYPDGKIGPNSVYFRLAVIFHDICDHYSVEAIVNALKKNPNVHKELVR